MINVINNSAKTLNIILPNTNRALKEVIQNISPTELQTLSSAKDLKSIVKGLFEQSKENPRADKMLLELTKKNPTLKELRSLTTTTKELVQLLKKETTPLPLQKQLTTFLSDIKDISPKNLQAKVLDSGIFLENKLKNMQAPQVELKASLQELTKFLETSKLPNIPEARTQIKELLSSDFFKDISNEKSIKNFQPDIEKLTDITHKVQTLIKKVSQHLNLQIDKSINPKDILFSKDVKDIIQKLSNLMQPENRLKNMQAPQVELKASLQELTKFLETSKLPNVQEIGTQIKEILSSEDSVKNFQPDIEKLTDITHKVQTLTKKLSQHLEPQIDKSTIPKDILFSKDAKDIIQKLSNLIKPENMIEQAHLKKSLSHDFKAILLKSHEEIQHSTLPNKQEILNHIEKTLLTIDYQQLVSHLSNATSLFIPYSWDALEEGEINIISANNQKFFTDIELQLKKFGLLKLRLGMFEKNQLNININAENTTLKAILQENMPTLKKQLIAVGVVPATIRFVEDTPISAYASSNIDLSAGFELKV